MNFSHGCSTVINGRFFSKDDSYRENENSSVEKQRISTRKENPHAYINFLNTKLMATLPWLLVVTMHRVSNDCASKHKGLATAHTCTKQ